MGDIHNKIALDEKAFASGMVKNRSVDEGVREKK
jgi:hypothetical protein